MYNAREVCKCLMQRQGVDFLESFAPVAKFASIRLLIAIAAFFKSRLIQTNVITRIS